MYETLWPTIVYGVSHKVSGKYICPNWLFENYKKLDCYEMYSVREEPSDELCYGVECSLDRETGLVTVKETSKEQVDKFYEAHMKEKGTRGYFLCVTRDAIGEGRTPYVPQ